jgi:hypothetical protein
VIIACTACALVLAACAAYARSILSGRQITCLPRAIAFRAARALLRIRIAILRARWAWRYRGRPPRNDGGPLKEWERRELVTILRGWGDTAPERSRA